jgi:hypothetical protein
MLINLLVHTGKGKAIPAQAWTGPEGCRRLRLPEFLDSRHMKVIRLSALHTPGRYFWYSFLLEAESTPGKIVRPEGRIK